MTQIFTVGHSNHSIERFVSLLNAHRITAIADVRSSPFSRYVSQFNRSELRSTLPSHDIHYVFLGRELGARPKDLSCYVKGKALYERIAATSDFAEGIGRLAHGSQRHKIAIMCAERDPITCHRAILVCQHLRQFSMEISHIHPNGELESHVHLERRMLRLHGLPSIEEKDPIAEPEPISKDSHQLSLFDHDSGSEDTQDHYSGSGQVQMEAILQEAYMLQGDRIAYVDKTLAREETEAYAEQVY